MTIRILSPGKLKERYWREAVAEYEKRLGRYCTLVISEVADEPAPEQVSSRQKEMILEKEGERLLRQIPPRSFCIALAINGRQYSSEEFSGQLETLFGQGKNDLTFVIGGSLGLSGAVLQRADLQLSFSKLTFPHQMMRVIALEQIYRAFRIMKHEPYHK